MRSIQCQVTPPQAPLPFTQTINPVRADNQQAIQPVIAQTVLNVPGTTQAGRQRLTSESAITAFIQSKYPGATFQPATNNWTREVSSGPTTITEPFDVHPRCNVGDEIFVFNNNTGTQVGSVRQVLNQIQAGTITAAQVCATYDFVTSQFLQQAPFNSDYWTSITQLKALCPKIKVAAYVRWDLWWINNFNQTALAGPEHWGTLVPAPTLDMGQQPLDPAAVWSTFQAKATGAPNNWTLDPWVASQTNNGALLTNPHQLSFINGPPKRLMVTSNAMRVGYAPWQERHSDFAAAIAARHPELDAIYVDPIKIQEFRLNQSLPRLSRWDAGAENPGWQLSTNTGGSVTPSWPQVGAVWDYKTERVLDVMLGSLDYGTMLQTKLNAVGLGQKVIYNPRYLTAFSSWRSPTEWAEYQNEYVARGLGTAQQARDNWYDRVAAMKNNVAAVVFSTDASVSDKDQAWRDTMRNGCTGAFLINQFPVPDTRVY